MHGDAAARFELAVEAGGDGGGCCQEGAPGIHLDLIEPVEALLLLQELFLTAGAG